MRSAAPLLDPTDRMRSILRRTITGCTYLDSYKDGDRAVVLIARRPDGSRIRLRFLGLEKSDSDDMLVVGSKLVLRSVGGSSIWRAIIPAILRGPTRTTRVRIEAGAAKLEIVCEDVEWWEDGAESARTEVRPGDQPTGPH